mgnify:CR=1 FL=1
MKWLLVLMVSVMTLAFSACGATATPEQELMERAESYYSELNRQNWSDARKYLAPTIQKVCPSEDFTVAWIFAASLIKGFADISATKKEINKYASTLAPLDFNLLNEEGENVGANKFCDSDGCEI